MHIYLGTYHVVNMEADKVDEYKSPISIRDARLVETIVLAFWYVFTTF